jgi:hypothetical protein
METWYHACGYPILVSSLVKQGQVVRVFFDSHPQSSQRTLTECPGCDRMLHLSNLVPDLDYDEGDEGDEGDSENETVD